LLLLLLLLLGCFAHSLATALFNPQDRISLAAEEYLQDSANTTHRVLFNPRQQLI
jgi:hypothetical protein